MEWIAVAAVAAWFIACLVFVLSLCRAASKADELAETFERARREAEERNEK